MKLWLLWQDVNTGYDTYDSMVVAAATKEAARNLVPDSPWRTEVNTTWALPADVQIKYLGKAVPGIVPGVLCASFNAG
jgi:hypothetical protein